MTFRRLAQIATALAVLAILAGPAWSARVVEVRIGSHPKFTRVVFELDAPAGYRIERRQVDGGTDVVVELSAASTPRQLKSRSPLVAGVDLEQSGADSVAHVRVRGGSPRVKEMILGGPPRIVLDFMLPDEVASETSTAPAGPKPRSATSAEAAPVVAKKDAPDAMQPKPEAARETRKPAAEAPKPKDAAVAPKPAETAEPAKVVEKTAPKLAAEPAPKVAEKPEPKLAAEPAPKVVEKPEPKLAETARPPVASPKLATPSTPKPADAPIAQVERALEGERIVEPKLAQPELPDQAGLGSPAAPADPGAAAAEPPKTVAKPPSDPTPKPLAKAPTPPTPMRTAEPSKGRFGFSFSGSDPWLTLGLVGGGLLLFLIVVVTLLRRHSKPTSLDALELAREAGEPMESPDAFETIASSGTGGSSTADTTFPVAGPGLFDDERDKGESEMDVAMDLATERSARAPSMASDADFAPLVQELERRMAQLEGRLDEANEARERLERQVTAQSEELRVQRAAIARTQRALRGMTRIGEEQATEPALRDPSKPSSSRG